MELPRVPIEVTSAYITDLTVWLRESLANIGYGDVGLRFTVCNKSIVRYEATYSPTISAGKLRTDT